MAIVLESSSGPATSGTPDATGSVVVDTPSGTAEGDVLVVSIYKGDPYQSLTEPGDWTEVLDYSPGFAAFLHVCDGTEGSSFNFGIYGRGDWFCMRFSGVDPVDPQDCAALAEAAGYVPNPPTPELTTVTDGAMCVTGSGHWDDLGGTDSPPGGWTLGYTFRGVCSSAVAYKEQATAGTTGTATWGMGDSDVFKMWTLALRPAAGGGGDDLISSYAANLQVSGTTGPSILM